MTYQLKISLNGFEPEIWRTFKIDGNATFYDLHVVIQSVMDWRNYHLYEFKNKVFRIGEEDEDGLEMDFMFGGKRKKLLNSKKIKLKMF